MTDTSKIENRKIDATRLLLFIIIGFVVSNIFRFDIFQLNKNLEANFNWSYLILEGILEGSGIFIAGFLGLYLLKKQRKADISFFGTSVFKSLLMASIPTALLIIIGVQNKYGINTHLFGLIAAIGSFIYCIMEEYGWRGYLQEEFKFLKPVAKFSLIGLIWYLWHLSFLTEATLANNLFFLGVLTLGSWGIGKIAELTNSILACSCLHLIVNIFMYNHFFNNAFSGMSPLIILVVSVSVWVFILVRWKKDSTSRR
ncbi:MAG: CPBP family intramembrane glutamic endopeptidase [Bacteroidia bacterium]